MSCIIPDEDLIRGYGLDHNSEDSPGNSASCDDLSPEEQYMLREAEEGD